MRVTDAGEVIPASTYPLATERFDPPRAMAYATLGALLGGVPLPWLPSVVVRKIRGTQLHDIAARHSVALTDEAREVLVDSSLFGLGAARRGVVGSVAKHATGFALRRALSFLGPLSWLPPVQRAFAGFVISHLFERYMATARVSRSVRLEVEEAKQVRKAIEQALLTVATIKGSSPWKDRVDAPEELRASLNRFVDGVVLSLVSLPGWFVSRLDSAFDDAWAQVRTS